MQSLNKGRLAEAIYANLPPEGKTAISQADMATAVALGLTQIEEHGRQELQLFKADGWSLLDRVHLFGFPVEVYSKPNERDGRPAWEYALAVDHKGVLQALSDPNEALKQVPATEQIETALMRAGLIARRPPGFPFEYALTDSAGCNPFDTNFLSARLRDRAVDELRIGSAELTENGLKFPDETFALFTVDEDGNMPDDDDHSQSLEEWTKQRWPQITKEFEGAAGGNGAARSN